MRATRLPSLDFLVVVFAVFLFGVCFLGSPALAQVFESLGTPLLDKAFEGLVGLLLALLVFFYFARLCVCLIFLFSLGACNLLAAEFMIILVIAVAAPLLLQSWLWASGRRSCQCRCRRHCRRRCGGGRRRCGGGRCLWLLFLFVVLCDCLWLLVVAACLPHDTQSTSS